MIEGEQLTRKQALTLCNAISKFENLSGQTYENLNLISTKKSQKLYCANFKRAFLKNSGLTDKIAELKETINIIIKQEGE